MSRLLIVSNRLPVTLEKVHGELIYHPSAGGLATGLNSLETRVERLWIGWAGKTVEEESDRERVRQEFRQDGMVPIFLTPTQVERYYEGFSNRTIWPLFHYFTQYAEYDVSNWEAYFQVNRQFTDEVARHVEPGDMVWVHDYQLLLVPGMLRERFPDLSIGFFLHIPFPSYEIFRALPWREALLEGMLGADLLGFHTYGYMRHFLSSVYRITGIEHHFGKLTIQNRLVDVDAFPMGIDYEKFAETEVDSDVPEVSEILDLAQRTTLILSIDRLDYSKGIPERIKAFEAFLYRHPEYRGKVTLVMVVVPSRSKVPQYAQLREEIDLMVGRINAEMGHINWMPIQYHYRSFAFNSLITLYRQADIALITPLRDGMNLVAKEFVATKEKSKLGVLVLSEMAGAATDLQEAIIINPHDTHDIGEALVKALTMPGKEQGERLEEMQRKLKKYTVKHWANTYLNQLIEVKEQQKDRQTKLISEKSRHKLALKFHQAKSRLLLLDYDGTLVGFHNDPKAAGPDEELLEILESLHAQDNTSVVIISGRDRYTLGEWFGEIGMEIISEHGVWRWNGFEWGLNEGVRDTWKPEVRPILESLVERTPGSFIEEKDYTLAWHYRRIDNELGENRVREIRDQLIYLTANHDLQVLEGNKVVEIRNAGVNKGKSASQWLNRHEWEFIMAIGDDHTDEDTFEAVGDQGFTVKVGLSRTLARYKVRSVEETRALLKLLAFPG